MDNMQPSRGQPLRLEVTLESKQGIAQRVWMLRIGRVVSVNHRRAATIASAAYRLTYHPEHRDHIMPIYINLGNSSGRIAISIRQQHADQRPASIYRLTKQFLKDRRVENIGWENCHNCSAP